MNAQQLKQLVQEDPQKAIEQIDQILATQNPTSPNTYNFHLLRGQAYLNPKALNYVEAGVSVDNLITIVEALKKTENTLPEQMKKQLPQLTGMAYQLKGQCEMRQDHYSQAAEAFQKAYDSFELFHKDAATITNMGKCYLKSDPPNKEQAIIYLKKSIEMNPDSEAGIIAIGEVGNLLDSDKQYEEALKYYEMGIKTSEQRKWNDKLLLLYTNKGNVEKNLLKYDEAIKSFEKAIELKPDHQNAIDGLSLVSYNKMIQESKKKNYSESLVWSERVLIFKSQDPEALFCKALALDNLGKKDECIVAYQEVIKVDPERLDALLNLGTILHAKRLFKEAIEYYEQANRIERRPEIYNNLGEAYKELNRFNEAFQAYDTAIQSNPNNVVAMCNRAQLNLKKGNKQLAMDDLKQIDILIQDPNNTKDLREKTLNYIKGSVKQILEIERAFEREKKAFEEQMKLQDQSNPEVFKILQQMEEIQKQKDLQTEQALNGVNNPEGAQGKMISISEIQLQMKQLMESLANISKEKEELKQVIIQAEEKIEEVKQEVDEQTKLLNLVGADKAAKVKSTYQAWLTGTTNDKDKYDYSKAFYWTFINYCDAQRIANTGIIKTDANSAVDSTTQTAVKVSSAILDLGASVPVFGSIFGAIKSAVDGLYKVYSEKQEEDKRMAILKVIQENQDAQDQQEWSMLIALAAQEIAVRKTIVFDEKHEEKLHPKPKGTLDRITSWISEKVQSIKDAALGDKIDLYESVGGEEAVADMIILLAFIQKNYHEMIHHRSQTLDKTIADIVYNKGGITPEFQSMLDAIDVREEQENPGKKAQTERTDQSCACNLI